MSSKRGGVSGDRRSARRLERTAIGIPKRGSGGTAERVRGISLPSTNGYPCHNGGAVDHSLPRDDYRDALAVPSKHRGSDRSSPQHPLTHHSNGDSMDALERLFVILTARRNSPYNAATRVEVGRRAVTRHVNHGIVETASRANAFNIGILRSRLRSGRTRTIPMTADTARFGFRTYIDMRLCIESESR